MRVHLEGPLPHTMLHSYAEQAFNEISKIEALMSFHQCDSELSRINRSAHKQELTVSPELVEVLSFALELSAISNGQFDVTVAPQLVRANLLPGSNACHAHELGDWRHINLRDNLVSFSKPLLLDLGGIAKGYAIDRALACIPDSIAACINAGGDLKLRPWQSQNATIRMPQAFTEQMLQTPMRNAALATSAGYYDQGQWHIFSPKQQAFITNCSSISVFADQCMQADALTKIAWQGTSCEPILRKYGAIALSIENHAHQWLGLE